MTFEPRELWPAHWVVETERLILRPPVEADYPAWAAYNADPEATRFIGGVQLAATAWRGMATMAGSWALKGFGMFSLEEKASGAWLGRVGPWQPQGWPGTEVGWGVIPAAQGKGFAAEAAAASIDWAFRHLGWSDVIHCIDPENAPSEGVARKLGSISRGPGRLPPPFEAAPINIWGQSREEWRARRPLA